MANLRPLEIYYPLSDKNTCTVQPLTASALSLPRNPRSKYSIISDIILREIFHDDLSLGCGSIQWIRVSM